MRIAIDLRPALKKNSRRRGIGKYTSRLVSALLEQAAERHTFVLYGYGEDPALPTGFYEYRRVFQLHRPSRMAWIPDRFLLPIKLSGDRVDVFHATELTSIIFRKGVRTVATIHDLIPLVFWEEVSKDYPWDYSFAVRDAYRRVRRCDMVITPSLHSKNDICERLAIPSERVAVVYNGCDPHFHPRDRQEAQARIEARYGISGPYLFYVGGTDFRKNLRRLVRAFSGIRGLGYTGSLVMAGETFLWDIPEVRDIKLEITRLGLEPFVRFPGYVSENDLNDFFSGCDMFVFPSLYEGFGLPVVEALKCGALVLASRASSIPEIGGDCAEYFDPSETEDLVAAFNRLYHDPHRQEELRRRGPEHASRFSWQDTGRAVLAVYDSLE